jgi:replicative DNA helicase
MIRVGTECVADAYDFTGTVDELLEKFEQRAMSVRRKVGGEIKLAKPLVEGAMNRIEQLWERKGSIGGISTGLGDLDRLTDGLHGGDMVIVSGFEKAGKTALAMGIVTHAILEQKLPVGVFPLEMSGESLMMRMLCSQARVNLRNIREGFMAEHDFPRIISAAGMISQAQLYIDDSADLTIGQLRAKARRMKQNYHVALIVVDYAQLITSPETRKRDNREQEVSAVSKGVKAMAKELNVPVLLLSQLNDEGKLRESRALGQDADAVWKLKYEKDEDRESDSDTLPMIIRVERSRSTGTGNVPVTFFRSITKFEQAAKHVSDKDVPGEK